MEQDSDPQKIGNSLDTHESRTQKFVCENTGKEFEAEQFMFGGGWFPHYRFCPEETERLMKAEEDAERERKRQYWRERQLTRYEKVCPKLMKETDTALLPQKPLNKILEWEYQAKGMILHGETGLGKTRCLWTKIKQWSEQGNGWVFYSSRKLQDLLLKSVFDKTHEMTMRQLCQTRILCIDDLGKEKAGDKWVTDLFDIIDRRSENQKPTFITTNYNGDKLCQKFEKANPENDETCKALLRRLRSFHESVAFKQEHMPK